MICSGCGFTLRFPNFWFIWGTDLMVWPCWLLFLILLPDHHLILITSIAMNLVCVWWKIEMKSQDDEWFNCVSIWFDNDWPKLKYSLLLWDRNSSITKCLRLPTQCTLVEFWYFCCACDFITHQQISQLRKLTWNETVSFHKTRKWTFSNPQSY